MSVVLLTGDAFFPSEKTGKLPAGEPDSVTTELFADLEDDIGLDDEAETVKYVNSVVLEIDIGEQEPGFVLNLYIKPNFQVVRQYFQNFIFPKSCLADLHEFNFNSSQKM